MLLRRSASSLCSFPLLRRRLGTMSQSKSSLFHSSQSHSSSNCFTDRAQFMNCIQNPITVDAFGEMYKEMLRGEPLPPAEDFALLFNSAVEMRYYFAVISFIRDMHSSVEERAVSIINVLVNCFCQLKYTDLGFSAMGYMLKIGLKPDAVTFTNLINGLCGEGKVNQAIKLSQYVDKMEHQYDSDIIGAILSGFDIVGDTSAAFRIYRIMALCKDKFIPEALKLCLEMTKKGIEPTLVTYNCLLEGLCNSGRWDEVYTLLNYMQQIRIMPDADTYNILAHAFSQEGMVSGVKVIMSLMIRRGLQPDGVTFTALIYAYCSQNQMNEATEAWDLMINSGCLPDIVTYNSLIYGFCKTDNIPKAADLIRETLLLKLLPDIVTRNIFMYGCFRVGEENAAKLLGLELLAGYFQDCNVHTRNIELDSLLKYGRYAEAAKEFWLFEHIRSDLNIISYNIMLHVWCRTGKLNDARELFCGLKRDVYSYAIMINGLCNAGLLDEAEELLINMEQNGCIPNGMTYNVLIRGLLLMYDIPRAIKYLQIMMFEGFRVDASTNDKLQRALKNMYSY